MNICFDDRWIGTHGIGRFATEISKRCDFSPLAMGGKPLDFLDPWRLRNTLLRHRPLHFFSPGFNAPLGSPCSFSLTVHDLIHLDVQDECSLMKRLYYRSVVLPAVRRADVIFTVSEYSRQKILEWSNISVNQIVNVGNGVNQSYCPEGDRWAWPRLYLLYVGNQKPHKNVAGLVKAYAASRLRGAVDLLLTGPLTSFVQAAVAQHEVGDHVHGLGLVPEADLPKLYRGAMAVVMPSRYEGFGLPLIEAMACGTAVLSSNRTSLPEVGGDAVAYFDPDDFECFVGGLNSLQDQAFRKSLCAAGLERAKLFSWDAVAARVAGAIAQRVSVNKA